MRVAGAARQGKGAAAAAAARLCGDTPHGGGRQESVVPPLDALRPTAPARRGAPVGPPRPRRVAGAVLGCTSAPASASLREVAGAALGCTSEPASAYARDPWAQAASGGRALTPSSAPGGDPRSLLSEPAGELAPSPRDREPRMHGAALSPSQRGCRGEQRRPERSPSNAQQGAAAAAARLRAAATPSGEATEDRAATVAPHTRRRCRARL